MYVYIDVILFAENIMYTCIIRFVCPVYYHVYYTHIFILCYTYIRIPYSIQVMRFLIKLPENMSVSQLLYHIDMLPVSAGYYERVKRRCDQVYICGCIR